MQIQQRTEFLEREFSESMKYYPQRSEQYAKHLLSQNIQIKQKFSEKYPNDVSPKQISFSQKRALQVLFKQIQKSNNFDVCEMVVTVLAEFNELKNGSKIFSAMSAKYPKKAVPYVYLSKIQEDDNLSRRVYQNNANNISQYEEVVIFYGNWLILEKQFIINLVGEGDEKINIDTLQDENLRGLMQGKLIKEVLTLAIEAVLLSSVFVKIPERQRISLEISEENSLWKLAGMTQNEILEVQNLKNILEKFTVVLQEYNYLIKESLKELIEKIIVLEYENGQWQRSYDKCEMMTEYVKIDQIDEGSDLGQD